MKSNVSNFICYIGQKYESDRQWEEEQEKRDKKNEKITLLKYLRISAKPISWLLDSSINWSDCWVCNICLHDTS